MSGAYAGVLAAVRDAPRRGPGDGCVLMLVAARRGEGVSTAAREAAEEAGAPVLLVDLDFKAAPQAAHYRAQGLGPAKPAQSPHQPLIRLREASGALRDPGALFGFHRVGATQVHVSAFDARAAGKARVQVAGDGAYWQALRASGALVIVDAPALERSGLALKLAPHMDAVVLVVAADAGAAPPALKARADLAEAGAHVAGLVFARASAPVIAIDRMLRAG